MIVHEYSTLGKGLGCGPLALGTKLLALLARFPSRSHKSKQDKWSLC